MLIHLNFIDSNSWFQIDGIEFLSENLSKWEILENSGIRSKHWNETVNIFMYENLILTINSLDNVSPWDLSRRIKKWILSN